MRRAASLVKLRDQELNIARHLSMYSVDGIPLDQPAGSSMSVQLGGYRVLDCGGKSVDRGTWKTSKKTFRST